MEKKTLLTTAFISVFVLSAVVGRDLIDIAVANPIGMTPAPYMPVITIGTDGNINPITVSIKKSGNVYLLTGDIKDHSLEIKCSNITLDGRGFSFQEDPPSEYAPSTGIAVYANGVTVKNLNIRQHDTAMAVYGANNTIAKTNFASSVKIEGNYNAILENTFSSYIVIEGSYNTIKGNILQGRGIAMSGSSSFNTVTANTIEHCTYFAVTPSEGTNFFYLNNFINNTNLPSASLSSELSTNLNLAVLAQTHISPFKWERIPNGWKAVYPEKTVFDNGSSGNYWSDYAGTDANHDGIGDTPYFIGGELQDNYPLMEPFDISSVLIELLDWSLPTPPPSPSPSTETETEPEPFPTAFVAAASIIAIVVVSAVLLVYFKRRKR